MIYSKEQKKNKSILYDFPKIIKELRNSQELTQSQVAAEIGVSYQSYQAYELEISLPSLENFVKLADFFEVSLDYMLGRKEY